jgi:hypothetical protein
MWLDEENMLFLLSDTTLSFIISDLRAKADAVKSSPEWYNMVQKKIAIVRSHIRKRKRWQKGIQKTLGDSLNEKCPGRNAGRWTS